MSQKKLYFPRIVYLLNSGASQYQAMQTISRNAHKKNAYFITIPLSSYLYLLLRQGLSCFTDYQIFSTRTSGQRRHLAYNWQMNE